MLTGTGPRQNGYPGKSLVGNQCSTTWLVIQDADPKVWEEDLPTLRAAENKVERAKSFFTLLVDRVRMREGEKRICGSQIQMKDDKFFIYPIEDEPIVNKRRAKMRLALLEDYGKHWGIEYEP